MPDTFEQAQARVLALNSDELPFVYQAAPYGIQAVWKYADVKWAAITAAGTIDASYELRVTLDPAESQWEFDETDTQSESRIRSTGGGGFSIGGSTSTFKGRETRKTFSFGVGSAASTTDRQGTHDGFTYGYAFTTDEIKEPLIAALEQGGWEPKKKGFFGKLFGG
ncbi:hypothetical protein QCD70_10610 [Agreia sp. PsM10]|uniref:hypothetical protein n=1 Tax=Agreia sp. PsM10 TaxID=3030533 RepID=UPI00263AC0D0|nr:hypothetical protein [Agreia sp. PsM10]MDN4640695.1 hypothetical protein [Agreia sp. PsM10]